MPYALIQRGYAIFGVGETPDEARADAAQWLDGDDERGLSGHDVAMAVAESGNIGGVDGELVVLQCTAALIEYVREHGTTTYHFTDDGILCLKGEVE